MASLGGYWLAGLNEAKRDVRAGQRDDLARKQALAERRILETRAFQRETLLELQDVVQRMARLDGRLINFDFLEARSGRYNSQMPDALDDESFQNANLLLKLNTRILDSTIRERVLAFNQYSGSLALLGESLVGLSQDELESRLVAELQRALVEYSRVMDPLGEAIRLELSWQPAS